MRTKFNVSMWRIAFVVMTLTVWVSLATAQDEVEVATEEAANFGPIWAILLAGLFAVAALGFLMNSGNSSDDGENK
jgi:hypothetical protein